MGKTNKQASKELWTESDNSRFDFRYVIKIFEKHKEYANKFCVGDILVATIDSYDEDYNEKTGYAIAEETTGHKQRYLVSRIDDLGVIYVKEINVAKSGVAGLSDYFIIQDSHDKKFELDPEYTESLLLGTEYDPFSNAEKAHRLGRAIRAYNDSIAVPKSEIMSFLKEKKPGGVLWGNFGHSAHPKAGKVVEVNLTDNFYDQITVTVLVDGRDYIFTGSDLKRGSFNIYNKMPRIHSSNMP